MQSAASLVPRVAIVDVAIGRLPEASGNWKSIYLLVLATTKSNETNQSEDMELQAAQAAPLRELGGLVVTHMSREEAHGLLPQCRKA